MTPIWYQSTNFVPSGTFRSTRNAAQLELPGVMSLPAALHKCAKSRTIVRTMDAPPLTILCTLSKPDSIGIDILAHPISFAVDHTASKEQDPIRTPPRSDARPGQYWAGGPPGNTKELTAGGVV